MDQIKKQKNIIDGTIPIAELVNLYPHIVDFLVEEYEFYCMNCFLSEFETLEQGAATHGIIGEDFEEMLKLINEKL